MAEEQMTTTGLALPNKDAEGKPQPAIIQQITVRPPIIRVLDAEAWRKAQRATKATIPRYVEFFDLLEDIMLDPHLSSVVEKRLMGVTNIEWEFVTKDGKPVQAINDWIDTPEFELLLREILNAKMWFYTMLEFDFYTDGTWGVFLIPRKHMRPKTGIVSSEQSAHSGIHIREGEYANTVLEVGNPDDTYCLLLKAAIYVIYKRGNFSDWAQFIERFGRPLIDAIWDGYDESQRLLLLDAIDKMGGGGQIVRPAGTQLQFLQGGANNPTGQLNSSFNDAVNAAISILILGQTETTQSSTSSGYAQASVHAETETDINVADRNFVRRILNRRVCTLLEANGIDTQGGHFQIKSNKDDLAEKKARLDIEIALKNQIGLPLADDYFYQEYGLEKPADYEAQKQAMAERAQQQQFGGGGLGMSLRTELIKLRDEGFFDYAPES